MPSELVGVAGFEPAASSSPNVGQGTAQRHRKRPDLRFHATGHHIAPHQNTGSWRTSGARSGLECPPSGHDAHQPVSLHRPQRVLAHTRRLGDNAGMARDDSWAQVLRLALPILDGARPAGMLGWVGPVAPVVTQAAVGAGHWAAGRRRRALAAWTSAAGYGLVAWGLGTEAPTPAEARQNRQQNIQRLQREGVLSEPAATALAAAGTQTTTVRRLSVDGPVYRLASTVVAMVLGVWWGLRWPRRLTVLAIAGVALNAVIHVPWVARAVQRRRPRMAAGYALPAAGAVARLRAASAEPLR